MFLPKLSALSTAGALRLLQSVLEAVKTASRPTKGIRILLITPSANFTQHFCTVSSLRTICQQSRQACLSQSSNDWTLSLKEQQAIAESCLEIVRITESFAPPPTKQASGLTLGQLIKDCTRTTLSTFGLCNDKKESKQDIWMLMAQKKLLLRQWRLLK